VHQLQPRATWLLRRFRRKRVASATSMAGDPPASEAEKTSLNPPDESASTQRDTPDTKVEMMAPKRTASGTSLSNKQAGSPDDEATVSLTVAESEQAAIDEGRHDSIDEGIRVVRSSHPMWHSLTSAVAPYLNKGALSNCATFSVMLLGMALKASAPAATLASGACADATGAEPLSLQQGAAKWLLAAGLFGFAGGITNWLAIQMLFDSVCGLPGSGVIPRRFKEIREVVKNTIMKTFFDGPYLEHYMNTKMSSLAKDIDLGAKLAELFELPEVDEMIAKGVEELYKKPEGMMLLMVGMQPDQLKPLVKPFLLAMAPEVGPLIGKMFNMKTILPVEKLRSEIDLLMTEKLQELTPEKVKTLMEEVIRTHLGWLIVWGNVFGSLIGVVSVALGYP